MDYGQVFKASKTFWAQRDRIVLEKLLLSPAGAIEMTYSYPNPKDSSTVFQGWVKGPHRGEMRAIEVSRRIKTSGVVAEDAGPLISQLSSLYGVRVKAGNE